MGNSPSFPVPGQSLAMGDSANTSTTSSDGAVDKSNSATVIVLGIPQPELVANSTTLIPEVVAEAQQEYMRRYIMQNETKSESAFVKARDEDGDDGAGGSGDANSPRNLPGNIGNHGGNGDSILPDEVADIFKLDCIGGLDDQKEYLQRSIILPLVRPEILREWGVSPPKGILLHGPPGTGKTFMAKSLVNELKQQLGANVNFFYRKGGDVFSMWFGESQRKLRQVFETAKAMAPSVIFFDEIDGLCPSRDGGHNHGTEAYASVVTCFLGQMDGLENGKVFVIAATNRLDAVDPAVRRPGRFDKHLAFGFPDETARRKIIQIHTSKWTQNNDKPDEELLGRLAQSTMGFSGADLEKLCKDVVYTAIEANGGVINGNWKITEDNWRQAMNSMQRTAVNSFGSSLYIATKPNQLVSRLIQPVVEEVIKKAEPFLTGPTLDLDPSTQCWLHKSLLVSITQQQSKSFLNNQILQGILSNPLFNKMALFELSGTTVTNKVMSGAKPSIMAVIYDVVNQALDAQQTENCAVVIVPNINELLEIARANNLSPALVVKALAKVSGPKMFLLATSSCPLDEIREPRVNELFYSSSIAAKNPRADHLQPFFQFVLETKKQAYPNHAQMLDGIATRAAKYAEKDNYEHILDLASELNGVNMALWQNGNALTQEFNKIFKRYVASKLR